MDALPPSNDDSTLDAEDIGLIQFGESWERGNELRSVIERLPGELVLKSGLSARRRSLLERWEVLESPGLDGSLPDGSLEALNKWIHDAEVLISYIVRIGRSLKDPLKKNGGRVYSGPPVDPEDLPQVIDSLDESEFVSDEWCWPWPDRAIMKSEKPRWDKGKLIKFGAVAALGAMALVTYLDEE